MKNKNYLTEEIAWNSTDDPEHPYRAIHDGEELILRLNDFPAEHLYTLLSDDKEIVSFDDWATAWSRASKTNEGKTRSAAAKSATRTFGKAKLSGYSARKG